MEKNKIDEEESSQHSAPTQLHEIDELWKQMALALESSKALVESSQGSSDIKQVVEDCEHSLILKDDIGEVCQICGLVKTPIERIIKIVFNKGEVIDHDN